MVPETFESAEPTVQQSPCISDPQSDSVEFENLLIRALIPSADDPSVIEDSATEEDHQVGNDSHKAPIFLPFPGNQSSLELFCQKEIPPGPEKDEDTIPPLCFPTRKSTEKESVHISGSGKERALPEDNPGSILLETLQTAPADVTGMDAISHPVFPQPESDDQKGVEYDVVPAHAPKKGSESAGSEPEHTPADSDKRVIMPLLDPEIADNVLGEKLQDNNDNGQQRLTSGIDQSLGLSSETGIQNSVTAEPENAPIPILDGGDIQGTTHPLPKNNDILIPRHAEQKEIEVLKVDTPRDAPGDKTQSDGKAGEKPLVVSEKPMTPIPVNEQSESFASAHTAPMSVRKSPGAESEFPPDDQQPGNGNRRAPLPTKVSAPSEIMVTHIEKGSSQENTPEVSPSQEPLHIPHAEENVQAAVKKGDASLELSLDTDGAGELKIELMLNKGVIHAQIHTSDEIGKNLIERNLSGLLQSLINEGLQVGNFSVFLKGKRSGMNDGMSRDDTGLGRMATALKPQVIAPMDGLVSIFV
jgi:flagellar hook-length control protein FliK